MDASIQTDHVDPQELLNALIQQHMEQERLQRAKLRHSLSEDPSSGLMKHLQQQQDPDAIHPLSDGADILRSEQDQAFQRNPSTPSKIKSKQHPARISFARDSKKCPSETTSGSGNSGKGKHSSEQSSLSDRICQVVWSRKESAPFVTPLSSKRMAYHSSARRGTSPNVPPMRHNFETKPDAFGGRSQSFKGSSSSGSVKKRLASCRDSLSRRASGDPVPYLEASASAAYRVALHPLKPKSKVGRHCVGVCNCSGEISIENGSESHRKNCRVVFGQNFESNSPQSSAAGSGQNLSSSLSSPQDPLEKKMDGLLVHHGGSGKSRCNSHSHDGDVDRIIKRQTSMTLSIPSREDSLRSCSSSKSYGSYSTNALPTASYSPNLPCTSSSVTNAISATSKIMAATSKVGKGHGKPSMGKLVRYGSNPDVSPSRRAEWKQAEQETLTLHQQSNRGKMALSNRSLTVGSNYNIDTLFLGGSGRVSNANSFTNLADKKKQILVQKQKRNEKVAWVVHLCFSSLLILAITCIVVFLRLSSTMSSTTLPSHYLNSSLPASYNDSAKDSDYEDMRKENENLLQSIQPQLNLNNITTPQPSTHTQQVDDNTNGNEDSGQSSDKTISSLQSGQPLTRTKENLILPSSAASSDSSQSEDGDGQSKSNNETTYDQVNIMSSTERRENEGERSGSIDRSNNNDSSKVAISSSSNNNNNNPSLKTNSMRPKRSRPRPEEKESEGGRAVDGVPSTRNSNIIISMLNEKVHKNVINDTPSSLMKARHLESTIIRFLKNSSSSLATRERTSPGLASRKL